MSTKMTTKSNKIRDGRWTKAEHERFMAARQQYGKNWRKIAQMVQTRSNIQCRTHAQSFNPHYMPINDLESSEEDEQVEVAMEVLRASPATTANILPSEAVLHSFRSFTKAQRDTVRDMFDTLPLLQYHSNDELCSRPQPNIQPLAKPKPLLRHQLLLVKQHQQQRMF